MDFDVFSYILLPLMIFFARICDVTIGTLRIILVAKGYKKLAPIFGFFEILIWIIAISQIMENLDNWICYLFYALGFATGNWIGMVIEARIALGIVGIRLITAKPAEELIENLRLLGYGLTSVPANGTQGPVNILYMTISRKRLKEVTVLVNKYNPGAFYTIEDVRFVNQGVFTKVNQGKRNLFSK